MEQNILEAASTTAAYSELYARANVWLAPSSVRVRRARASVSFCMNTPNSKPLTKTHNNLLMLLTP